MPAGATVARDAAGVLPRAPPPEPDGIPVAPPPGDMGEPDPRLQRRENRITPPSVRPLAARLGARRRIRDETAFRRKDTRAGVVVPGAIHRLAAQPVPV